MSEYTKPIENHLYTNGKTTVICDYVSERNSDIVDYSRVNIPGSNNTCALSEFRKRYPRHVDRIEIVEEP